LLHTTYGMANVPSKYQNLLQTFQFAQLYHTGLEFGHPRCICNNEVKYNEGQNTTKFIS